MYRYILKRVLMLIPVLLGVSLLTFSLLYLAPGDIVTMLVAEGGSYSEEAEAELRAEYGLDDPFFVQYFNYIRKIVTHFDFGTDYKSGLPVSQEILARAPTTALLASLGIVIAVFIGIPIGILSAVKQYSIFDMIVTPISIFGVAVPNFWLGLMLIIIFALNLGWLPASGFYGPSYWILPAFTVGFNVSAYIMRMTRSSMLEVIRQDYIRTARAKGQLERVVITKHALKNALIPIITSVGLQFGYLLGGSVLAESVFSIPGLGKFVIDGIKARNSPVVQGGVLFYALCFSIVNLLVDILYAFVDPRVKSQYSRKRRVKHD